MEGKNKLDTAARMSIISISITAGVVLAAILLNGMLSANTPYEIFNAVCLTLAFLFVMFFVIEYMTRMGRRHPYIASCNDNVEKAFESINGVLEDLKGRNKELDEISKKILTEANKSMARANALGAPNKLIEQQQLVIGSSDEELMKIVFKNHLQKAGALKIEFMGTAYGAFSLDVDEKKGYGLCNALIEHIDNCEKTPGVNKPFESISILCGHEALYALSARYLLLTVVQHLIKKGMAMGIIKIGYPQSDCIPATLIIKSDGEQSQALISPSIGIGDKEFLSTHYPFGLIIKDMNNPGQKNHKANITIDRMRSPFFTYFKNEGSDTTKNYEVWSFNSPQEKMILRNEDANQSKEAMLSPKCITDMVGKMRQNGEFDEFKENLFKYLFWSESDSKKGKELEITSKDIESAISFIGDCIRQIETSNNGVKN